MTKTKSESNFYDVRIKKEVFLKEGEDINIYAN